MKLALYDKACAALAQAKRVDEVKAVRDRAEAARAYARQAKNRELEVDAAEIRIRAERRLGELLAAQKSLPREQGGGMATGGDAQRTRFRKVTESPVTLSELGIDKKLSSRAQALAAVPERRFEAELDDWRQQVQAATARVTTTLVRLGEQRKGRTPGDRSQGGTVSDLQRLVQEQRRFGTIYADPPWRYGNQGTRAATDNHYPTMSLEELCALPLRALAAEAAHLHLWTTNAFLFEAKVLMEAWGFIYKSCFIWVKPQMGIGNYWRVSHEFLLLGVRGGLPFADRGLKSWGSFDRGEHSEKPGEVRLMVEKASPGPRLELFGRAYADGWTVWGNEIAFKVYDPDPREAAS